MQQDIAPAPAPPAVPTVAPPARKRIGEILIERGRLDAAGLDRALRLQQGTHEKIGGVLGPPRPLGQGGGAQAAPPQLRPSLVEAGRASPAANTPGRREVAPSSRVAVQPAR